MELILALLLPLAIMAFFIACQWIILTKAGQPGWACLVPIYNIIVYLRVAGKPWYWLFLFMIPLAGIYFAIVYLIDFVKAFGKGGGFVVGLIFLPFIFLPLLAFGDAKYVGAPQQGA